MMGQLAGSGGDGSSYAGSNHGGAPAATPRVRDANERAAVRAWHSESDKVMIEIRSPARVVVLSRFAQLLEQQGLHSFDFTASTNDRTNVSCVRAEVKSLSLFFLPVRSRGTQLSCVFRQVEAQLSAAQLHALQSMLAEQILQSAEITTVTF